MSQAALAGRVALITGGSRGIGRAIAERLASEGARVAVCATTQEGADKAAEALGEGARGYACNVGDRVAVEAMVKAVAADFGALDIVISNAGIARDGLLLRAKPEDWQQTIDVNLAGAFFLCKTALRYVMKARDAGRIVLVSSVVGEQGNAGQTAYAASKAGLLGFARALAREVASRGVTVNAITPGFIETKMTQDSVKEEARAALLKAIPLGRIGSPEDVAAAASFLCGPGGAYVTGQVLRVNGGLYM